MKVKTTEDNIFKQRQYKKSLEGRENKATMIKPERPERMK